MTLFRSAVVTPAMDMDARITGSQLWLLRLTRCVITQHYRCGCLTENALIKVCSDLISALDYSTN